jgi:hypothetical protein
MGILSLVTTGNSPYESLSYFAGNGLLISPDWLIEDGRLRLFDCQGDLAVVSNRTGASRPRAL